MNARALLLSIAPLAASAQPGADDPALLCVVAPAEWAPLLQPFVSAREKELAVELVPLEAALAGPGADAPERLKRFLFEAWRGRKLRYALLVGDADTLPVRFMALDRRTEAARDLAYYASDLYYADLAHPDGRFDDWNGAREGASAWLYGEVRGETHKQGAINHDAISYLPEIAVGRWPVSEPASLAAVVAKTLRWDPSERAGRVVALHADGWIDARAALETALAPLAAARFELARQVYGDEQGGPSPERALAALRAGVGLALHVGHGTREGWDQCLAPAQLDALANAPSAIYLSVGCSTAHLCNEAPYEAYLDVHGIPQRGTNHGQVFTELPPPPAPLQPGRFNTTGFGERMLRAPAGGAVAYIGCTTGAQPCALTLLEGFLAAAAEPGLRVGDAWVRAVAHYHERERLAELVPTDSWYPPSIFFQAMKFVLFGDPSLPLPAPPG